MELQVNMNFFITEKFIPNFCNSQTLQILHLNEKTVKIEMNPSKTRGAFPINQFKGLVKNATLILEQEGVMVPTSSTENAS